MTQDGRRNNAVLYKHVSPTRLSTTVDPAATILIQCIRSVSGGRSNIRHPLTPFYNVANTSIIY